MQLQPGQTILGGKYRVERLLGRGAFGEVYLATHLELNVPRAVKVLHRDTPGVGSTEFGAYRGRFQLEAQVGARLDHRHVVRVYDFEEADGALYLVMAYCPGGSLKDHLAHNRETRQLMPVEEARHIATDLAHGLAAIHALEIVHRDLKPSNVLFDADGGAQVGDLGLAQVPGASLRGSLLSVPAPDHPGTPEYMSPEQETTKSRLRPPSDVYALGAILFEMLTGQLYNNVRPGTRVRSLRAETPAWLDDLIAGMLAQKPEDRPWDGAEAARLLERGGRSKKRLPVVLIAAGLALVVLAAGAWALIRRSQPVPEPTPTLTAMVTATASRNAPEVSIPTMTIESTKAPEPALAPTSLTPTETAVPVTAPAPSVTPSVVVMATSSPTHTPTAKPKPTADLTPTNTKIPPTPLPEPILENPPNGESFNGSNADIKLAWRSVKPTLASDEYYLVNLDYKHGGQIWTDYVWTKQNQWLVKEHAYLLDQASDGRFTWAVKLMQAAALPADGKPTGAEVLLSGVSQPREFLWTNWTYP